MRSETIYTLLADPELEPERGGEEEEGFALAAFLHCAIWAPPQHQSLNTLNTLEASLFTR